MKKMFAACVAIAALAQPALAQAPAGAPQPATTSKNPAAAASGSYKLDRDHASIIARVGHRGGLSISTFRFNDASGTLDWNSADPAQSKLSVTVDMKSITSPAPNFANELVGDRFLKTAQFPTATFVSKSIARTGPTGGKISGELTFMGQTKPAVIDATLVGTTLVRGAPVLGFSGSLKFKRSDFGFSAMVGPISDEIELVLDVEFDKTA